MAYKVYFKRRTERKRQIAEIYLPCLLEGLQGLFQEQDMDEHEDCRDLSKLREISQAA